MTISTSALNGTAGTPPAAKQSDASGTALASDFGTFLQLLTTQLQNQNPLSPMDADKFTSQLVQFSSVEQAIRTNGKLDELIGLTRAGELARAHAYVGSAVRLDGSLFHLGEAGGAEIRFTADRAADLRIDLLTEDGQFLATLEVPAAAGENRVRWDGRDQFGRPSPAGTYRAVVGADTADAAVAVDFMRTGTVDAVEFGADGLVLEVDGTAVPAAAVRAMTTDVEAPSGLAALASQLLGLGDAA